MLGLMKFKKLFWKKSDEHDKLDELDHEFIAGFTKREIIRMIQNMSDEELENRKKTDEIKIKKDIKGYLRRYSQMVSSADKGAIINK